MDGVGASQVQGGGASNVDDLVGIVDGLVVLTNLLPAGDAVSFSQKVQQVFAALELAKMAELKASGVSRRERERRAGAGGTRSKKSAARASKRADVVEKNPKLADDVRNGELGDEQLDALAHGAEKTGGDAACDETLIDKVKGAPADDAGKIVSRYLEERDDDNGAESRYERQRRRRGLRFGRDPVSGCDTVTASGDRESVMAMERLIKARANELYDRDGGRNLPADEHPRTHQQRMFDALCQLLSEGANSGSSSDAQPAAAPPVRSMVHVSITVDDTDADLVRAVMVDGDGYLPRSVLEKYGCGSMVAGTVFGQRGEVLWFGRQRRHATPAQWAALVARDGGCVICRAEVSRCEAHHVQPFNAPIRGDTDIENLALVCIDDHHLLHQEQLTLYWQLGPPDPATGLQRRIWSTRRATPDEVAPKTRRPTSDSGPKKQRSKLGTPPKR